MPEIKLVDVSIEYKNKKNITNVLEDFSVVFPSEKISVVMGFSGVGKTTLLKVIAGLEGYYGDIYIDNVHLDNIEIADRSISYVSQKPVLYKHLNVRDNLAFPLKSIGISAEEISQRIDDIAFDFEIRHLLNRKPNELSVGQQQIVSLAKALIKKPKICLLDEAMASLDNETKNDFLPYVRTKLIKNHITTIYVTHNVEEAFRIGDYFVLLKDSKNSIVGDKDKILNSDDIEIKSILAKGILE